VKEKTRLLVCSGNHDLDTRDENGEKISRWILDARLHGALVTATRSFAPIRSPQYARGRTVPLSRVIRA
jgi:hypothetical protein